MTIPFIDLFKKLTGRGAVTEDKTPEQPRAVVVRPKKPEAERLRKTVMPNATRSMSTPDPFRSAATTAAAPRSGMPLELGARKITAATPPRSRGSQLPPALARALEPKVERTVSLRVADLVDVVPCGFIKPVEILDTNAVVALKASELEKGMPEKHPSISLPSLYQQVPEIFLRTVRPDDDTRVELPYEKVLEQFQTAQVRADQVREPALPHVDTPILKATIEDSTRFGTKIEPLEISLQPGVPVKTATAQSIAEAEPDAMPAQIEAPAKSAASGQRVISLFSELKPKRSTATETAIPFELSPNGTGASASERVPASSGPPVPTPLPFTPDLAKIAFELPSQDGAAPKPEQKSAAPAVVAKPEGTHSVEPGGKNSSAEPLKLRLQDDSEKSATAATPALPKLETPAAPQLPVKPTIAAALPVPAPKSAVEQPRTPAAKSVPPSSAPMANVSRPAGELPTISFSLKAVLQSLPAFQLTGDATAVSDDARMTLPLKLVESQLASGRVSVAADVFQAALPSANRGLFQLDVAKTPVVLPLEEVLKNLPATVLKLREDQETFSLAADFETPFSVKAKEDAARFAPKPPPESSHAAKAADAPPTTGAAPAEKGVGVETKPAPEKVDPKQIVAQANGLTGITACAITFSDGLSLAGELPEEVEADGLCVMAPSMLERITQHVHETKLGQLIAMTLYVGDSAISFFGRGNVCLSALHDKALGPEVRTKLAGLAEKLSKTYGESEKSNVDH